MHEDAKLGVAKPTGHGVICFERIPRRRERPRRNFHAGSGGLRDNFGCGAWPALREKRTKKMDNGNKTQNNFFMNCLICFA
jgi:hypothetical protein